MPSILIVDDHTLFREGLRSLIATWEDFDVVGEAANGGEALRVVAERLPDIVLMDVMMPVVDGITATAEIKHRFPGCRVVMLTMSEEDAHLFQALKAGACGYILKGTPARRLHDHLRGMMRDETPISAAMATRIVEEFKQPHEGAAPEFPARVNLSDRERSVLELLAKGDTNTEIASRLFLSESSIKKILHCIMQKLHLKNRVEAVAFAIKEGIVDR